MSRASETGKLGEAAVRLYLEKKGAEILDQNYRIAGGEIDIIAALDDELLFVEVKTRRRGSMVSGFEAVTERKKMLIMRTAAHYCMEHETELQPRFDVAVVSMSDGRICDIDYLENAFDMSDCDIIF